MKVKKSKKKTGMRLTTGIPPKEVAKQLVQIAKDYSVPIPSLVTDVWAIYNAGGKLTSIKSLDAMHKEVEKNYEKLGLPFAYIPPEALRSHLMLTDFLNDGWYLAFAKGDPLDSTRAFFKDIFDIRNNMAPNLPKSEQVIGSVEDSSGCESDDSMLSLDNMLATLYDIAEFAGVLTAKKKGGFAYRKSIGSECKKMKDLIKLLGAKMSGSLRMQLLAVSLVKSMKKVEASKSANLKTDKSDPEDKRVDLGSDIKDAKASELVKPEELLMKRAMQNELTVNAIQSKDKSKQIAYVLMDESSSMSTLKMLGKKTSLYTAGQQAGAISLALLRRAVDNDAWFTFRSFSGDCGKAAIVKDISSFEPVAKHISCTCFHGGGTNGEGALLTALRDIRGATDELKKEQAYLKKATIILISDGIFCVDPDIIKKARKDLPTKLVLICVDCDRSMMANTTGLNYWQSLRDTFDTIQIVNLNTYSGKGDFLDCYKGTL